LTLAAQTAVHLHFTYTRNCFTSFQEINKLLQVHSCCCLLRQSNAVTDYSLASKNNMPVCH